MSMSNKELMDCLYTDLNMLLHDEWVPDRDSTECSIEILEELAENLGVELEDKRQDEREN